LRVLGGLSPAGLKPIQNVRPSLGWSIVEWISPAEIGKELKVPTKTVYGFVRDDGLPAIRIGRHLRISRTDLDIWLDARRVGAAFLRRHGITPAASTRRPQRRPLAASGQRWRLPRGNGDNAG